MLRTTALTAVLLLSSLAMRGSEVQESSVRPRTTGCTPGPAQCENCLDDDQDGFVDMNDVECAVAGDDAEDSFQLAFPGESADRPESLDCWFDTNVSNADGCDLHACCMLDGPCPPELAPELFDPQSCTPTPSCRDSCLPITKSGCDCFGCCEVCSGEECFEVFLRPVVSPSCTVFDLGQPSSCLPCTRSALCAWDNLFIDGFEDGDTGNWSSQVEEGGG